MSSARPASASSYGSQAHREKLLRIKEREDLKGLIVQKFIEKYRKPGKRADIQRQVDNFMKANSLTEANLRALDEQIQQEIATDAQSFSGISVQSGVTRESEVNRPGKAPSVVSYMSGASDLPSSQHDDAVSVASQKSSVSSVHLPPNKDEWATILDYTAAMHRQQEQLRAQKEREQKQSFRKELDLQMQEKQKRLAQAQSEQQAYVDTQTKNLAAFDAKERQRQSETQRKRAQEKETRNQQLKEQRAKKRSEAKQTRAEDVHLLQTLQAEEAQANRQQLLKKQEEMRTAKEILAQNSAWKQAQMEAEEREKQAELRRQAELNTMLDKLEEAKQEEARKRDERQAKFLTDAANGALKSQQSKVRGEDQALLHHFEARNRFDEEQEAIQKRKLKEQQMDIRSTLQSQMKEKRERELRERRHVSEQADMWRKEDECKYHLDHTHIDALENKQKKATQAEYVAQLKQQIEEKATKDTRTMTAIERALNKPLIREILEA